jgi:hypothetical protein
MKHLRASHPQHYRQSRAAGLRQAQLDCDEGLLRDPVRLCQAAIEHLGGSSRKGVASW